MINKNLNIHVLSKSFQKDRRLMINGFLLPEATERMRNACLNNVPFSTQYVLNGTYQSKSANEIANQTNIEKKEINRQIIKLASKGIGFLYEGYLKSRASNINISNSELIYLHSMFDYMASNEVLEFIRQITINQNIAGVEPQFTRFKPGHFLTRHLDIVPGRKRLYAFVLGLTKNWHPDWGGLLQFYEKNGTPRDSWMPQFNVLSIFEVSHIHSVTYVTDFAIEPRISLTGWFVAN